MLSARVWVMSSAEVGVLVSSWLPQCSHWHLEERVVPLPLGSWPAAGSGYRGIGGGASREAGTLVGAWSCPSPCSLLLPPLSIIVHYIHLKVSMVAVIGVQGCFIVVLSSTCS